MFVIKVKNKDLYLGTDHIIGLFLSETPFLYNEMDGENTILYLDYNSLSEIEFNSELNFKPELKDFELREVIIKIK